MLARVSHVTLMAGSALESILRQLMRQMGPVAGHNLAGGHTEGSVNTLLHIATISGVLASLMRHFRASLSSLPLLGQPINHLPIGSWSPEAQLPALEGPYTEVRDLRLTNSADQAHFSLLPKALHHWLHPEN